MRHGSLRSVRTRDLPQVRAGNDSRERGSQVIWVLVLGGILMYLGIGLLIAALGLNYIRHFEIWDAAVVVFLWPLALVVWLFGALVATLDKVLR